MPKVSARHRQKNGGARRSRSARRSASKSARRTRHRQRNGGVHVALKKTRGKTRQRN